jgi:hypothetical protein
VEEESVEEGEECVGEVAREGVGAMAAGDG